MGPLDLIGLIGAGSLGIGRGKTCISGGKRGIFRDCLLEGMDAWACGPQALLVLQSAGAKVEIMRFGADLVAPAAAPKLQAQAVDDPAGNLVLDSEHVGQLAVIPA